MYCMFVCRHEHDVCAPVCFGLLHEAYGGQFKPNYCAGLLLQCMSLRVCVCRYSGELLSYDSGDLDIGSLLLMQSGTGSRPGLGYRHLTHLTKHHVDRLTASVQSSFYLHPTFLFC